MVLPQSTAGARTGALSNSVAGPPFTDIELSATVLSQGFTLTGPPGSNYSWAVVNNVTPFIAVVSGSGGSKTLQPYTYDKFTVSGQGSLSVELTIPAGTTAPATPGAPSYVQADWYLSSASEPFGVYPGSLTSQADLAAALTVAILAGANTQILALQNQPLTCLPGNLNTEALALDNPIIPYPVGLAAENFHTATVIATPVNQVYPTVFTCGVKDSNGVVTVQQTSQAGQALGVPSVFILPLIFGASGPTASPDDAEIFFTLANNTTGSGNAEYSIDVILDQSVFATQTTLTPNTTVNGTSTCDVPLTTGDSSDSAGFDDQGTILQALWMTLSVAIESITGGGLLVVSVVNKANAFTLGKLILPPVAGAFDSYTVTFPIGGVNCGVASGTDYPLTVTWGWSVAPSAVAGQIVATVGWGFGPIATQIGQAY